MRWLLVLSRNKTEIEKRPTGLKHLSRISV